MITSVISVENLKCGGCANSIKSAIVKLTGVSDVAVDKETSVVTVNYDDALLTRMTLVEKLKSLGYPEENTENDLLTKAKSYVSCAIGRIGE
ncbi:MAG: heavy-metal-associated domain-containing protein [Spirosomaceae bacterium]|jgi:copper chaperone CopZ|nr:heavy-metal-associated domain-containing protein [Spirosomataceae bacterium]